MRTRVFESYGIFITIAFARNLDREPMWRFIIENVEDQLFESGRFGTYEECEYEALRKAVGYLPDHKPQTGIKFVPVTPDGEVILPLYGDGTKADYPPIPPTGTSESIITGGGQSTTTNYDPAKCTKLFP